MECAIFVFICAVLAVVAGDDPRLKFPQDLRVHTAQKFTTISTSAPQLGPSEKSDFKVAVVMSGHIRSFAFSEKSWQRYMSHDSMSNHLYFFANALATKRCRISSIGIDILKHICTEFAVSYSNYPSVSASDIKSRIPSFYSLSQDFSGHIHKDVSHGNYFDMHHRRHEAYKMADRYAKSRNIKWDLIAFVRFDIAFYDPALNFAAWHSALQTYHDSGGRGIISPPSCNFHGVCDRFAVGRPEEMALYFDERLPYAVLGWSMTPVDTQVDTNVSADIAPSDRHTVLSFVKVHQQSPRGNSEHLLECWFIMNNLTQLWVEAAPVSFTTLRTAHASAYCAMDRQTFVEDFQPQEPIFLEVDRCTAAADVSPYKAFDMEKSRARRCGPVVASLNSSALCAFTPCACGRWD